MELLLKILFAILLNGFGLIIFWSFHTFKIGKKDNEYDDVIETFGLRKKFEESGKKKVERKPSTVLRKSNYALPLLFFTMTTFIISSMFLFPSVLFGELFEQVLDAEGNILETTRTFAHNPFFLGMHFGSLEIGKLDMNALEIADYQRRSIATLAWGFVGAFLWAASNMVRRLAKADITPILYYKSAFRILFACSVALVFSFISSSLELGNTSYTVAFVPALAFIAGTLPDRFFDYLLDLVKNLFVGSDINTKELKLAHIEGLSASHRERLWEEGIDNAQNLAETSITQLLLKTPFEARQLLDWIGQAKLLVYMKDDIGRAHALGIRSVYDLVSLKEAYSRKGLELRDAVAELGESAGFSTPKLAVVAELVNENLGIKSLKGFMDKLNGKKVVTSLYENADVVQPFEDKTPPQTRPKEEKEPNIPGDVPDSYD